MKKTALILVLTGILVFGIVPLGWNAETIKVGTPMCFTGPYAADGVGYFRGVEMAVEEINQAGGLLGKTLEIVKYDIQDAAPERVMQAAADLVQKKKVDALHCGWAGWGQDVMAYGNFDVPTFTWDGSIYAVAAYKENPKKYSNWFQLNGIEKDAGADEVYFMANLPYKYPNKKVVVISTDDPFGMETAGGIAQNAKDAGWEIVLKEVVPYGTREWGPILSKIRTLNPAWIHVEVALAPDLITFHQQFIQSPTQSLIHFGYGLTLPDFLPNMEKNASGLLGYGVMIPDPAITPESAAWVKRFKDKYDTPPVAASFPVYTGVMIWAQAVRKVGDEKNYTAINSFVAGHKFKTLEGRDVWFDKEHKIPISIWPANWVQIQDGKMITLALSSADKKKQVPYQDFKFQVPPWINK